MKRIFVDMDGTLCRFHDEVSYLERMWEKDFFRNLKPFENMVAAVNALSKFPDVEVFILSAAIDGEPPYCRTEKHSWIDKFLPNIDEEHRIFTTVGKPKSEYILDGITEQDYLIDDYNVGLEEWQRDGGTAIKCKNNINHRGLNGPLWQGKLIDNSESPDVILRSIRTEVGLEQQPQKTKGKTYGR